MAPPRKPRQPRTGHPVHVRLPSDVFQRIDAEAKAQGRPMNRIIVNGLARLPWLEEQAKLGQVIQTMETVLARYAARVSLADADEDLLNAVGEAVAAQTDGELLSRFERVRVAYASMKRHVEPRMKRALDADDERLTARLQRFREAEARTAEEARLAEQQRLAETEARASDEPPEAAK